MRGTYLRVGLLAALSLALLLGVALMFGSTKIRHGQTYETYFRDSVQGLEVGAPVKYRGVAVGQVTSVGLVNAEYGIGPAGFGDDPEYRLVLVRLAVDTARIGAIPDAAALVQQGLRARIAPQGLTGQSYLELDFMDTARYPAPAIAWTPRDPFIPSAQSTLSQVTDSATALLGKLAKIDVAGLANGLQGLIGDLHGVLHGGQMDGAMSEAADTLRLVHAGLLAADLPALATELRATMAAVRSLADGPPTRALLRSATQMADRLNQVTAKLPPLLAALQTVAQRADTGSAAVEASLTPLLRDAQAALAALRQTSEALRQDPAQLVLQGAPPRGLPR